jgi:hypothetical protein
MVGVEGKLGILGPDFVVNQIGKYINQMKISFGNMGDWQAPITEQMLIDRQILIFLQKDNGN